MALEERRCSAALAVWEDAPCPCGALVKVESYTARQRSVMRKQSHFGKRVLGTLVDMSGSLHPRVKSCLGHGVAGQEELCGPKAKTSLGVEVHGDRSGGTIDEPQLLH